MTDLRKWILTALVSLLLLPAWAGGRADTTYTFRFVPGDDMFYVPFGGNDRELARLLECVRRNRDAILGGSLPLYVDGYCDSLDSEKENLRVAAVRSNRVKSELIVRQGLTEDCFVTENHSGGGDCVTVRIVIPTGRDDAEEARCLAERDVRRPERERDAREQAEPERAGAEEQARAGNVAETVGLAAEEASVADSRALSLRANLLRWATLIPDIGLEWRVTPSVGVAVNGSWTSWSWSGAGRRYALWEVAPELRWYLGREKRAYLGAMFKAGQFNHKLSATGRQGDLTGGGITGGCLLPLAKALSLDFSLALGCLRADYEKYTVVDGVRVRAGKGTKNWWGPVNAGVTLVWRLF